jgi:hypothetical protein
MRRATRIADKLALLVAITSSCVHPGPCRAQGCEPGAGGSVAVYALSRGQGVPSTTRLTYQKARALLQELEREKRVARLEETRVGLEGELRLCAEFTNDRSAHEAIERLHAMARDVDLLNVVEEPCRKGD